MNTTHTYLWTMFPSPYKDIQALSVVNKEMGIIQVLNNLAPIKLRMLDK